ncbi:hypothetical protein ElyMa_001721500 [Elysia marginata]|uniref:Uncharacterized protein n=1 Tax=Elysia marginata TaxID=1093978 RepID=A0AAV4JUR7_9GAST|nr:hypothetical protein ElyMa_001721500 [Elysia marginata]
MERPKRNIRRKLDFDQVDTPETSQPIPRNQLNRAAYKARLKTNPAAYEAYKLLDAQRARERRQRKKETMTEEERLQHREKGRARQKAYRLNWRRQLGHLNQSQRPDLSLKRLKSKKKEIGFLRESEDRTCQARKREEKRKRTGHTIGARSRRPTNRNPRNLKALFRTRRGQQRGHKEQLTTDSGKYLAMG